MKLYLLQDYRGSFGSEDKGKSLSISLNSSLSKVKLEKVNDDTV